jgi:hypothetical protein
MKKIPLQLVVGCIETTAGQQHLFPAEEDQWSKKK